MSEQECKNLLLKYIISIFDYDRMINNECDGIHKNQSYKKFVDWNIECLKESSIEDIFIFKMICNKIGQNKIGQMDMESCIVWKTTNIFFDTNKNLVIVHPR